MDRILDGVFMLPTTGISFVFSEVVLSSLAWNLTENLNQPSFFHVLWIAFAVFFSLYPSSVGRLFGQFHS